MCVCVCVCVCVTDWLSPSLSLHAAFPLVRFLQLLQDYSLHLCLTADHSIAATPTHPTPHPHLVSLASNQSSELANSSCRLYHSHSVISAILSAKQLLSGGAKKQATPLSANMPPQVELTKQDNSGKNLIMRSQ